MSRYDDLADILRVHRIPTRLTRLSKPEIEEIRGRHPGVPKDYLDFLREIGAGALGDVGYMIYGSLLEPDDIFGLESRMINKSARKAFGGEDENAVFDDPAYSRALLFGDNFSKDHAGFDTGANWQIVVINAWANFIATESPTFEEFIRREFETLVEAAEYSRGSRGTGTESEESLGESP